MYSSLFNVFALVAAAAGVSALPTAEQDTPPASRQGPLYMKVDGELVSLTAVSNGTLGNLVLKAGRPSGYPGTPAYFNGTSPNAALNFIVEGRYPGIYPASTQDVGDSYRNEYPVRLIFGDQQFEWSYHKGAGVNNYTVGHKLYAAPNSFFACNSTIEGQSAVVLSFGDAALSGAPKGCSFTEVFWGGDKP